MDILVFSLFLVSLMIMIAGLLNPRALAWAYGDKAPSRARTLAVFGTASLIFFLAFMFTVEPVETPDRASEDFYGPYPVTEVVDGDTIEVDIDGDAEQVRLIGIDAPELVHPDRSPECYAQEASGRAEELIEGEEVVLLPDYTQDDRDKYGRLLRYVFLGDGTHINLQLLEEGMAYEYTHQAPYRYLDEFVAAEEEARDNGDGLWHPDTCDGQREVETGPSPEGVVKMSGSGICHAPGSTYYEATANYEPYESLQDCLDDGGRLPQR